MVFYRTPWTRYGIPWNCIGTSGNPMAFHGTPRYSMEFHGIPWNSMDTPWNSMDTPWNSMDSPWILHGSFVEFHGFPSISIEFHGFPWISMEFHGGISHGDEETNSKSYRRGFYLYEAIYTRKNKTRLK